MSALLPAPVIDADLVLLGPQPGHSLGPVADDWAAIEVWLAAVADNSASRTGETLKTYRYHLAKLRWYCDTQLSRPPSMWSAQDVKAFKTFLADLPQAAVTAPGTLPGEDGYTPFRKQPSASSQADILRFLHALFKALHGTGYIRLNPMVLMKTGKPRRIDTTRAIDLDLYEYVLAVLDAAPRTRPTERLRLLRDRFIFICLRETGLRASELVGATMLAMQPLSDPKVRRTYWVLKVEADTAKGGKERTIPVSTVLLDALIAYRRAFGLAPLPDDAERRKAGPPYGLVLSVRTHPLVLSHGGEIKYAADRRYFKAWRSVTTRMGLHEIIKERIAQAVEQLKLDGDHAGASQLSRVSAHWMRHTFAKAALLAGQDMRMVATALGHASVTTTMIYTEQDALDQIRSWEAEQPGKVAQVAQEVLEARQA
jgi:integrase/recombinase XerC